MNSISIELLFNSFTKFTINRNTFRLAVSHVLPHVIVFMGDLMDEGSVAKNEEFQRYVNRFKNIFYVPNNDVTVSRYFMHPPELISYLVSSDS